MAFWILDDYEGEALDYPTLGFTAEVGDILEASAAPDPRWSATGSGPETVQRYTVGSDPSYVEPDDGHVLAWSDVDNAYVPTNLDDPASTPGSILHETFASRATQDTVELGRLNNGVLSGRFGIPHLWIGAEQMWAGQGTPTAATISSFTSVWKFNSAADQGAVFSRRLPKEWATFDVYAVGANGGAGAGDVRLVGQWRNADRDGDLITGSISAGSGAVITAAAQHEQQRAKVRSDLTNDDTARHHFRIYRTPTDAADTLGNDWNLVGVLLVATSLVAIEPEFDDEEEEPAIEGRTFTQAMNALLDIAVHHQHTPPPDDLDDVEWQFFPATAYSSRQVDISTSTWSGGKWGTVWDNRWNYGDAHSKKPNLASQPEKKIGALKARTVYSSQALAMAATRCQVRHYLGYATVDIEAIWTAAGGDAADIITNAAWTASPETYATTPFTDAGEDYLVAVDTVILPPFQFDASFDGVWLDYEPHDTRTPAETLTHITNLVNDCHSVSKDLFLYTNVWNGGAMPYNGLDGTNAQDVLDVVDGMTVLLWSDNDEGSIEASYDNQIAMIETAGALDAAQWAKLAIIFELGTDSGGTTLDDAEWVYNKMHEVGTDHPETIVLWRKGAEHGGPPSRTLNKRISMVCFGTETPPTP